MVVINIEKVMRYNQEVKHNPAVRDGYDLTGEARIMSTSGKPTIGYDHENPGQLIGNCMLVDERAIGRFSGTFIRTSIIKSIYKHSVKGNDDNDKLVLPAYFPIQDIGDLTLDDGDVLIATLNSIYKIKKDDE